MSEKRLIYFDILKIFAAFGVIVIHVNGLYYNNIPSNTVNWQILNFYNAITLWCVPMFIMISGSLFLFHKRYIPIKLLYRKYIPNIFIKMVIWAVLYSVILYRTVAISPVLKFSISSHLYFLYIICFLYIITPILSFILQKTSGRIVLYFLFFLFSCTTFCSYMFNTVPHNKFVVLCILCNEILKYIGYYILGYWISFYGINNITRRLIYCCAIICFLYIILKTSSVTKALNAVVYVNPRTPLAYLSGFNIIITTALFVFCKSVCENYHSL